MTWDLYLRMADTVTLSNVFVMKIFYQFFGVLGDLDNMPFDQKLIHPGKTSP